MSGYKSSVRVTQAEKKIIDAYRLANFIGINDLLALAIDFYWNRYFKLNNQEENE